MIRILSDADAFHMFSKFIEHGLLADKAVEG